MIAAPIRKRARLSPCAFDHGAATDYSLIKENPTMTKGLHDWHSAAGHLLEAIADSLDGFEQVLADPHHAACQAMCIQRISERKALLGAMREALRSHGLTTVPQATIVGSANRLFMHLRSKLPGSDAAVIEEILNGEQFLATKSWRFAGLWRLPRQLKELALELEDNVARSISELHAALHAARTLGSPAAIAA
jgi:hypothetical protein